MNQDEEFKPGNSIETLEEVNEVRRRRGQQERDKNGGGGKNLAEKSYISRLFYDKIYMEIKMEKTQKMRKGTRGD